MFIRYHLKKPGERSISRLEDGSRLLQSVLRLQDSSIKIKGIAGLCPRAGPTQATKLNQMHRILGKHGLGESQLTPRKVPTAAPCLPVPHTSSPLNNKFKG